MTPKSSRSLTAGRNQSVWKMDPDSIVMIVVAATRLLTLDSYVPKPWQLPLVWRE